ncbi:MAG: hypothetical protein IPK58_17300 [Acidobacteria bacterium]|nr:hypothetical protein [Acidobacteriota bacterium]
MGILGIFKRRAKNLTADERRSALLKNGRMTDGTIIDSEINGDGDEVIYFIYTINGVDFESSDRLTEIQRLDRVSYAPGAKVSIRFDTRNHGNAIVV